MGAGACIRRAAVAPAGEFTAPDSAKTGSGESPVARPTSSAAEHYGSAPIVEQDPSAPPPQPQRPSDALRGNRVSATPGQHPRSSNASTSSQARMAASSSAIIPVVDGKSSRNHVPGHIADEDDVPAASHRRSGASATSPPLKPKWTSPPRSRNQSMASTDEWEDTNHLMERQSPLKGLRLKKAVRTTSADSGGSDNDNEADEPAGGWEDGINVEELAELQRQFSNNLLLQDKVTGELMERKDAVKGMKLREDARRPTDSDSDGDGLGDWLEAADDEPAASTADEEMPVVVGELFAESEWTYADALAAVFHRAGLDKSQQSKITDALEEARYEANEFICRQGEDGDKFFIIKEGEVVITRSEVEGEPARTVTHLYPGHFFGETSLRRMTPRNANVQAVHGPVVVLFLTLEKFQALVDQDVMFRNMIDELVRKNQETAERRAQMARNVKGNALPEEKRNEVKISTLVRSGRTRDKMQVINDYVLVRTIGAGSFGVVSLGMCLTNGKAYAIKCLDLSQLRRKTLSKSDDQILKEVAVMKRLVHRNIVGLFEVIRDYQHDKLYLVQEYVKNGSIMPEEELNTPIEVALARRYIRDTIMALEYLQFQGVVHRDIKPGNLMAAADGTCKVGDFGSATVVQGEDDIMFEVAGTPAFMAPELFDEDISESGYHGYAVDMWALGCTLYTLVVGQPPFMAASEFKLVDKIRGEEPPVSPTIETNPHLRHLLKRLLIKDPAHRMTLAEMKEHDWVTDEGAEPLPQQTLTPLGLRNTELLVDTSPNPNPEPSPDVAVDASVVAASAAAEIITTNDTERTDDAGLDEGVVAVDTDDDDVDSGPSRPRHYSHTSSAPTGSLRSITSTTTSVSATTTAMPAAMVRSYSRRGGDIAKHRSTGTMNGYSSFHSLEKPQHVLAPVVDTVLQADLPAAARDSILESVRTENIQRYNPDDVDMEITAFESPTSTAFGSGFSSASTTQSGHLGPKEGGGLKRQADFVMIAPSSRMSSDVRHGLILRPSTRESSFSITGATRTNTAGPSSMPLVTEDEVSDDSDIDEDEEIHEGDIESVIPDDDTTEAHTTIDALTEEELVEWQALRTRIPGATSNPKLEICSHLHMDQGPRAAMEDCSSCITDLKLTHNPHGAAGGLFAVYDGHNGDSVALYVRDRMHALLSAHPELLSRTPSAMEEVCLDIDAQIMARAGPDGSAERSGCAANMLLVLKYPGEAGKLICANVGDSRAVLSRNGAAMHLSVDQKVTREDERTRIEAAGGWIIKNRLHGVLAVSRSFGDVEHKGHIKNMCQPDRVFYADPLIATPEVVVETIQSDDEFAIVASDGLWDVMTSQEAVDFVRRALLETRDLPKTVEALVRHAVHSGGVDNVTAIVVCLNQQAS